MIEVKNLVKTYVSNDVETHVLRDISLKIGKGEFVAIIGSSGAGKSTLLYQLSLLDSPSSGEVCIDGEHVGEFGEREAAHYRLNNFGFVFQDYALVPELTALENIIAPCLMLGIDADEAIERATKLLRSIELDHRLHHLPNQMSGGEQQRVSVVRAIIAKPKILFADEPTASLDSAYSLEVMKLLQDLHAKGQTIVMVTHEMEYARMADRIITIKDGKVVSKKTTGSKKK